jgi:hypothetical protein
MDPAAVASGFDGVPTLETARDSVLQFEDTSPAQLGLAPDVVSSPARSICQHDLIALRLRQKCCWASLATGAVQVVNSVTW